GASETIGSLEGTGDVALGLSMQLTVTNNSDAQFNGKFTGFGPSRLIKEGTGNWTLGGASDQFFGSTIVNHGILSAANLLAASLTTVNAGGTLKGQGLVGNVLSLGGVVSPGCCTGMMRLGTKNLSLDSSSTFRAKLDGSESAFYSQASVVGSVN